MSTLNKKGKEKIMKILIDESGFAARCEFCKEKEVSTLIIRDDEKVLLRICTICADELWELLNEN